MSKSIDSNSAAPIVEAQGLIKVFGDFWLRDKARAVDGIDFEIRPNEVLDYSGPMVLGKAPRLRCS